MWLRGKPSDVRILSHSGQVLNRLPEPEEVVEVLIVVLPVTSFVKKVICRFVTLLQVPRPDPPGMSLPFVESLRQQESLTD